MSYKNTDYTFNLSHKSMGVPRNLSWVNMRSWDELIAGLRAIIKGKVSWFCWRSCGRIRRSYVGSVFWAFWNFLTRRRFPSKIRFIDAHRRRTFCVTRWWWSNCYRSSQCHTSNTVSRAHALRHRRPLGRGDRRTSTGLGCKRWCWTHRLSHRCRCTLRCITVIIYVVVSWCWIWVVIIRLWRIARIFGV